MARRGRKKKEKPTIQEEITTDGIDTEEREEGEEAQAEDANSESLDEDFEENEVDDPESVPEIESGSKDQGARLLEIRRAIEERAEQRRFKDDLDYLDEEI